MTIQFAAQHVGVSNEEWGWLVVWSVDDTLAAEQYVMLQAAQTYSEEDVRLGMNDIYIECCTQAWSWYGHILSFVLSETSIELRLDREAAERMGNDGCFVVTFSISEEERMTLRSTLRHVFNGRGYYVEA